MENPEVSEESDEVTQENEIKFDLGKLLPKEESLEDILVSSKRVGWKPDVSGLVDAIVDGKLIVPVGEKVLIEYTTCSWRDTTTWIVCAIDPPGIMEPGYVRLWDPVKCQYGSTSYVTGPSRGLLFKVPDKSKKWLQGEDDIRDQVGRRRIHSRDENQSQVDADGNPIKKKRGRPKGSLNKATLEKGNKS